ncbi:DUF1996 domain-containing protein [Streptomyces sp. NPDC059168]|uniref:DUF1996 domain-containing protein n=1 Tax=Streptomyces sp. NPDC059168 TaxID=3346753 RepID=UPI0036C1AD58
MQRNRRRKAPLTKITVAAVAALMLGGGGLFAVGFHADAQTDTGADSPRTLRSGTGAATLDCPDVGSALTDVPERVRDGVDRQVAALDDQVSAFYTRLNLPDTQKAEAEKPGFVDETVLRPLAERRGVILGRIADLIGEVGTRPTGLGELAACTVKEAAAPDAGGAADGGATADGGGTAAGGEGGDGGGGAPNGVAGPVADDFADITTVQPNVRRPATGPDGSTGTFTSSCGTNAEGKFNTDNLIVAPGVSNGAHHTHDYIGNQATDAFASDQDLAAGDTTCANQGDKSTYYWPVLRLQNGKAEFDADRDGGGKEGNIGEIQRAEQADITFVGNPTSKVVAMPKFLRIITGDAKAFTNGDKNANASWSCTGFEDRQLKDKYPLCPDGSKVVRTFHFQSCWDGQNIDSANHRTHVAFADPDSGACPDGFRAIPQLVQRLVFDVPRPVFDGADRSVFAVDGFPEQLHKPITDHDDFINVFDEDLMNQMVDCINSGRKCS